MPTRKKAVLDLIIVTARGVLGDEDSAPLGKEIAELTGVEIEAGKHMATSTCISKEAEIYELKLDDFMREAKKQPNWPDILSLLQMKREKFAERVL